MLLRPPFAICMLNLRKGQMLTGFGPEFREGMEIHILCIFLRWPLRVGRYLTQAGKDRPCERAASAECGRRRSR